MANLSQKVKGIMGQIDAIITMVERYNLSLDIFDNLDLSLNPMEILLELLKRCGVSTDEIVAWLSQYIVEATPIIEIALKGLLLAQLKSNVDCNLDPRIPQYLREKVGGCTSTPFLGLNENTGDGSGQERGIEIDLSTIDYYGMLNNSPMSDRSQYNYFGTKKYYKAEGLEGETYYTYEDIVMACLKNGINTDFIQKHSEIDSIYELVRAKDMNAFLWFILHKARFLNVQDINKWQEDNHNIFGEDISVVGGQKCILTTLTGSINTEGNDSILKAGDIFTQNIGGNDCSVMAMCIKNTSLSTNSSTQDVKENSTSHTNINGVGDEMVSDELQKQKGKKTSYNYTIVPTTNVWNGCNWYVNRSLYFDFWDEKVREYDKEFALFRLAMKNVGGVTTNKLVFTIKPGPNLIIPKIKFNVNVETTEGKEKLNVNYTGDVPWNFFRLCFDVNGKQDFWGKYSIVVGDEDPYINDDSYTIYDILNPNTNEKMSGIRLWINKKTREYFIKSDKLNDSDNLNDSNNLNDFRTALYECYPGFTVYEFNYDFIMGMRFFDPTVIVAKLIEGLTNIRLGLNVKKTSTDYQMRISEIVKNMMETNGYESTDCFFTFSNAQYDRMQEQSELKRAQLYPFQDERYKAQQVKNEDVYSILNEYDTQATLEENISVVNRAITNASATITQESLPEDKYSFGFNFITQAIEMLSSIFVESLLSPKLLMVFVVNQKIMGGESLGNLDLEKILEAFLGIIMSMINEIIDMILKKILEYVLEKIADLLEAASKILLLEKVDYYSRLMRLMLEACAFSLPSNPNLASTLDVVDYADIDENDKPITNEC